jgi:Arc/MetJ-type ribon-helix-helix transcriptional regulator
MAAPTIKLPANLDRELTSLAKERRTTRAEVLHDALHALAQKKNGKAEIEAIRKLMTKYASVPMSLADACLVRMTELNTRASVVTLDQDFRIYRRNGRQTIPSSCLTASAVRPVGASLICRGEIDGDVALGIDRTDRSYTPYQPTGDPPPIRIVPRVRVKADVIVGDERRVGE